jgi:hypothetical protein
MRTTLPYRGHTAAAIPNLYSSINRKKAPPTRFEIVNLKQSAKALSVISEK